MKMYLKNSKGFTLIELLVVISIIGLLSSIVLASLESARVKARDAKRALDMRSIYLAINLYYDKYGCLPITSLPTTNGSTCATDYGESNFGAWDYSSQGGFMSFLKTDGFISNVPVDPINNMTGDGSPLPPAPKEYSFRYHCYTGLEPSPSYFGPHLGYWRESDQAYITVIGKNIANSSWADNSYVCR